jgi:hypothetical protein
MIARIASDEVLNKCKPIQGWMYDDELLWLYEQARKASLIVEVGVWQGRSTTAMCLGTTGIVYAVDHWQGSPEELANAHSIMQTGTGRSEVMTKAMQNLMEMIDQGKCVPLIMSSERAADFLRPILADRGGADMIFLDGAHDTDSFRSDLLKWKELISPIGLLCGHDRHWPGVSEVLAEVLPDAQKGPGSIWFYDGGIQ